jgi:microcystin degradation protein MlrC
MTKRIAFVRIMQETNALSPVETTLGDFENSHYVGGETLLRSVMPGGHELKGYFKKAELAGFVDAARGSKGEFEPVPIFSAWASSGGPLSTDVFETLEQRMVDGLRAAGRIDGIYVCLHGAMGVVNIADPETRLLRSARRAIGGGPVVTTHDLHGNITRARFESADAIVGYHTNPHRDHARCGRKAGDILIGMLRREIKPTAAWRTLPVILGGGKTLDFLSPMRAVFRRMNKMEKMRNVLATSTFMVHPWNDDPGLGWATVAVTNNDRDLAERLADELAEMNWQRRHEQPPEFSSASQAIATARSANWRRKFGVVMMSDASDVVTAGAPGDSTHLLRALLEQGQGLLTYAAVRDPDAIAQLWERRDGDVVALTVGGKLDPSRSSPLPVTGKIVSRLLRPGFLKVVVLAVEHIRLVITEGPAMVMRPAFYKDVGLDIWKADVVVVKNFFPFLLFFLPYNRKTVFVRTQGTTDFDASFTLTFDGPVHPRDHITEWRTRDNMRRGIAAPTDSSSSSAA